MANAQTLPPRDVAVPLKDRVPGGREIWLLGRFVIGVLFFISGVQKLMGLQQFAGSLARNGIPETIAPVLAPIAAAVETIGGLCIAIGFATSWISLLMIAFTLTAAFVSHRFWQFEGAAYATQKAHFIKNMMIAGAFCLLYVSKGGPCSIDRWRREAKISGS
jgi:putative oxidoreductase